MRHQPTRKLVEKSGLLAEPTTVLVRKAVVNLRKLFVPLELTTILVVLLDPADMILLVVSEADIHIVGGVQLADKLNHASGVRPLVHKVASKDEPVAGLDVEAIEDRLKLSEATMNITNDERSHIRSFGSWAKPFVANYYGPG